MNQSSFDEEYEIAEDYFFGEEEVSSDKKVYALVIYDIVDNKNRNNFAKFMKGFGERVQKSCFEVSLKEKSFKKMMNGIGKFCKDDDSIRVYRVAGKSQVFKWGRDDVVEEEDVIIW